MKETTITEYITATFAGVQTAVADGNTFFFYGPEGKVPEHTFPFATLVTTDEYDTASNLNRSGVFRLNIGVSKATYQSLMGPAPSAPGESEVVDTGHDFTVLDQILPHPIYAHLNWVCVLNPGEATFLTIQTLLAEAYDTAKGKQAKRKAGKS